MIATVKVSTGDWIRPRRETRVRCRYIGGNKYEIVVPADYFPHARAGLHGWEHVRTASTGETIYQALCR